MTTNFHTAIPSSPGQPANAATFNSRFADLDEAIGLQGGGADATAAALRAWAAAESFRASSITRNANGVITDATLTWPDGSAGVLETTHGYPIGSATPNTTEAGWVAPQIITITHVDSSQTVTITTTRNTSAEATAVTIAVA